jgi:Mor family transcriptional regulator
MKNLKKELQSLNRELKALVKKTERLINAAGKHNKPSAVKSKAVKKKVARKTIVVKKGTKLTATDNVMRIINKSKKGVDVPTLMKKTGFNEKKVRNIIFRTNKQGNIKRVRRGLYVGA